MVDVEENLYVKDLSIETVSPLSSKLPLKGAFLKIQIYFIAIDVNYAKEKEKEKKKNYYLQLNMKKKSYKTKTTTISKEGILEFEETCKFSVHDSKCMIDFLVYEENSDEVFGQSSYNLVSLKKDQQEEVSLPLKTKVKGLSIVFGMLQLKFKPINFGKLPNMQIENLFQGAALDELKKFLIPGDILSNSYNKGVNLPFEEDRMEILKSLAEKYYFDTSSADILISSFRFTSFKIQAFELIIPKLLDLKNYKNLTKLLRSHDDIEYVQELATFYYLKELEKHSMKKESSFQPIPFSLPDVFEDFSVEIVTNPKSSYPYIITNQNNELLLNIYNEKKEKWESTYLDECYGDISAIIEDEFLSIFYVGYNGCLNLKYQTKVGWKHQHEGFKDAGKVHGRISVVFEAQQSRSAVFFPGVDGFVHYLYFDTKWLHTAFKKYPCKGDVSATYEPQRQHAAFCFEGKDNQIHYYYIEKGVWAHDNGSFSKHPIGGPISILFEPSEKHTSIFYVTNKATVKNFHVPNGTWKNEQINCKEIVKGDLKACVNQKTNHSEFFFTTKHGLEHFYWNGKKWENKLYDKFGSVSSPIACCWNEITETIDIAYFTTFENLHYLRSNGKEYQLIDIPY
eukprot:gene4968-8562_t